MDRVTKFIIVSHTKMVSYEIYKGCYCQLKEVLFLANFCLLEWRKIGKITKKRTVNFEQLIAPISMKNILKKFRL